VTNFHGLDDRKEGLSKNEIIQVMYSNGEKWSDVTDQIK
jgi:hypothetical protein